MWKRKEVRGTERKRKPVERKDRNSVVRNRNKRKGS